MRTRLACAFLILAACTPAEDMASDAGLADASTSMTPRVDGAIADASSSDAALADGSVAPPATPNPAPSQPMGLLETLDDLAAFGEKRVGTDGGARAGQYVFDRMRGLGLSNVHYESFHFPKHDVVSASMNVVAGGEVIPMAFDVFEGSGSGHIENARIVFAGTATDDELRLFDVEGKIALVRRSATFHRSSQYQNLVREGALAMLYVSEAEENLIQIGSIRHAWEAMGSIPALTIGKEDGDRLFRALLRPLRPARASIDVVATSSPGEGRNVIGTIPGASPAQILIGAHYDTWFTGSVDNGSGVAAMLGLAGLRAGTVPPYTLTFVAYDGEEVALYGGYDYLRKHGNEDILAVINFEMPSAEGSHFYERGIASSASVVIDDAIRMAHVGGFLPYLERPVRTIADAVIDQRLDALLAEIDTPYKLWVDLDFVTQMFGGVVPTDIQGLYRSGIPSVSTAVSSPWYHTTADTPDKVDLEFLADGIARFDDALTILASHPHADFVRADSALYDGAMTVRSDAAGNVTVDVALASQDGAPLTQQDVTLELFCNDFYEGGRFVMATDGTGGARFALDRASLSSCVAPRYVHASAGAPYPHVELAQPIP